MRGTVSNASAHRPAPDGRADVAGIVGRGTLAVVRSHPRWREPYTGITPLANSEVATDLARYLTDSEQTPAAVGLGVAVSLQAGVEAAGGFLVQALPGVDDDILEIVERNVRSIWSPAAMVSSGARGRDIVEILLQGVGRRGLERSWPRYHCPCARDRVTRTVVLLGREELRQLAREERDLEIRCEFCGERYVIGPNEIGAMAPDS